MGLLINGGAKIFTNFATNQLEITVGDHAARFAPPYVANKEVNSVEDFVVVERFERVEKDKTPVARDEVEDITNAADGSTTAMGDIIMERVAEPFMLNGVGVAGAAG